VAGACGQVHLFRHGPLSPRTGSIGTRNKLGLDNFRPSHLREGDCRLGRQRLLMVPTRVSISRSSASNWDPEVPSTCSEVPARSGG
jgi:hypothetical protein